MGVQKNLSEPLSRALCLGLIFLRKRKQLCSLTQLYVLTPMLNYMALLPPIFIQNLTITMLNKSQSMTFVLKWTTLGQLGIHGRLGPVLEH